jgi:hypothetical protein
MTSRREFIAACYRRPRVQQLLLDAACYGLIRRPESAAYSRPERRQVNGNACCFTNPLGT